MFFNPTRRITMNLTRIRTLALGLGLACLLPAGSVLAQNPDAGDLKDDQDRDFAHEIATSSADLTVDVQDYRMGVDRTAAQNIIIRYTLSIGKFGAAVPVPTLAGGGGASATITLRSGGNQSSTVEFDVDVVTPFVGSDTGTILRLTGAQVNFPSGSSVDTVMQLTVDIRDTVGPIDTAGDKTRDLAALKGAASLKAADAAESDDLFTVVDVNSNPPRTEFVEQEDTRDEIARVPIKISNTSSTVFAADGTTPYELEAADRITLTVTGDFSGLDADNFCLDLDDLSQGDIIECDTTEKFTIVGDTATLTLDGDISSMGLQRNIVFAKEPGVVLSAPRTFGISATIAPQSGVSQNRSLIRGNSDFWQWGLNGEVLTSNYIAFIGGNETKFRFTSTTSKDFLCFPEVTLDQGTFDLSTTGDFGSSGEFVVPANGNIHVELSNPAAAGTGAIGPLVTLTSGQQPVRGRAIFTCLTAPANVTGVILIASPVGVISVVQMTRPVK